MMPPFTSPGEFVRNRVLGEVRRIFHDQERGEQPVQRSDYAWFARGSVIWRVHGDVAAMSAGGIAALLLQMMHPLALAGVLGHSAFRADMLGRLRRTARFIAVTTYGERGDADAAIARVQAIHARVKGTLPDGRAYSAEDSHLLAWIHVAEALSFLAGHIRFVEPAMTLADQNTYFAEFALIARRLGADPVPETLGEARALLAAYRPELAVDESTRAVGRLILGGPDGKPSPGHALLAEAAIGLLPPWARTMLGLQRNPLQAAGADLGARALGATLRWAFAGAPAKAQAGAR
jgi:uncharacterized protein (DUF2236 family)